MHRERLKRKHQNYYQVIPKKKLDHSISNLFTRCLVAVIFVLVSAIYVNLSSTNLENYRHVIFESNLSFTKINEWYTKYFGDVLPIQFDQKTVTVNHNTNDIASVKPYRDGVSCETTKGGIVSTLNSGILVYMGEKEGYGNVAIIQGIDGVDIWYGNVENINLSLYDYVEKNSLLGSASASEMYLVFQKDGQFLDYEEYKKQI